MTKNNQIDGVMKLLVPRLRTVLAMACSLVLAFVLSTNSQAKSERTDRTFTFRFHEAGQSISATEYVGSGKATHLGVYTSVGTLSGSSCHVVYTSPSGDRLYATYTETVVNVEGSIVRLVATGLVGGGTGRFANATGSFHGVMTSDLTDGSYEAAGNGVMTLADSETER